MPEYPYNPDICQTDLMGAAYNGDADEVQLPHAFQELFKTNT